MKTYRIIRFYFNNGHTLRRAVRGLSGLTEEQAQKHCNNPETSSSTCKKAINRQRTRERGPWFDGYEEEK